jgi:hypothetical protein
MGLCPTAVAVILAPTWCTLIDWNGEINHTRNEWRTWKTTPEASGEDENPHSREDMNSFDYEDRKCLSIVVFFVFVYAQVSSLVLHLPYSFRVWFSWQLPRIEQIVQCRHDPNAKELYQPPQMINSGEFDFEVTYSRIGLPQSYGNLQSYWTTTKLWKLTVVLDYYETK